MWQWSERQKTNKYVKENTMNLKMIEQLSTNNDSRFKNQSDPAARILSPGGCCQSVVMWMQHLAVIYAKAEKHYEKTFSKRNSLQQFALYGGKTTETNIWQASVMKWIYLYTFNWFKGAVTNALLHQKSYLCYRGL